MNDQNKPGNDTAAIEVTFYYGSHELRDDATLFQPYLDATDIYVPEVRGWTANALDRYANVANGTETPEQANQICVDNGEGRRKAFTVQLWKMLYGSDKQVVILDIPSDFEESYDGSKNVYETLTPDSMDFSEFLYDLNTETDNEVANQDKREDFISERLMALVEDISTNTPSDEQVHVLLTIGAIHTRLFERFVSDPAPGYVTFKQVFSEIPQPYYYRAELIKRKLYGEEIGEELLAKVFLEDIFEIHVEALTSFADSNDKIKLLRKIIEPFSFDDTQKVFETWDNEKIGRFVAIEIMKTEGYQED
jgi:hypothetical protein